MTNPPPDGGLERYTRSGTRRAGDDYQDSFALRFILEWLRHPDRYAWMRVEADEAGYLDDVVCCFRSGEVLAVQVKFSTHPERSDDPYDWNDLLDEPTGKRGAKRSLLGKWADSFHNLRNIYTNVRCVLASNRRASDALRAAVNDRRHIELARIESPELRDRITAQLGGASAAAEFLDSFELDLDRENLTNLEDNLQHQFLSDWGSNTMDWYRLKDRLRKWMQHPDQPNPDGRILLRDIKIAVGWRRLQRLPEEYTLPTDFAIPDRFWNDALMQRIEHNTSDAIVIVGPPGSGKSTYVTFVFEQLTERGLTVIRHYYHLPERSDAARRSYERVGHELMYQIEDQLPGDLLDDLESLPASGSLSEWIRKAAHHLQQRGRKLVLIVDGLDHVSREERGATELDRLFEHLLPIPNGLILIVGTQPIGDQLLPHRLLTSVPRNRWLDIPRLSVQAIRDILGKHAVEFGLSDTDDGDRSQLDRSAVAIEAHTSGLPLLVKYLLRSLSVSLKRCDPWAVSQVTLAPNGELEAYYRELWHALSHHGQNILSLVAAVSVPWTREWLFSCLDPTRGQRHLLEAALNDITHLLEISDSEVRVVHSSLTLFVLEHFVRGDSLRAIRETALDWIDDDGPERLRWGYSWTLAADLGNPQKLIDGPTRKWLADAFEAGRPLSTAVEILDLAATRALEAGHLARHIELVTLSSYLFNALEVRDDEVDKMEYPRLFIAHALGVEPVKDRSSPAAFLAWAEYSTNCGRTDVLGDCFNAVQKQSARRHAAGRTATEIHEAIDAQLWIAALDDDFDDNRLFSFFNGLEDGAIAAHYADALGGALRAHRKLDRLRLVIENIQSRIVKMLLARHLAVLLREERLAPRTPASLALHPLQLLLGPFEERPAPVVGAEALSFQLAISAQSDYTIQVPDAVLCDSLERLLLAWVHGAVEGEKADYRLDCEQRSRWLASLMGRLRDYAGHVALLLQAGQRIPYSGLYTALESLSRVSYTDDELGYRVYKALRTALPRIAESLALLSSETLLLDATDVESVWRCKLCDLDSWLEWCWRTRRRCLGEAAVAWLAEHAGTEVERRFGYGNERSAAYSGLAAISIVHEALDSAKAYLNAAAGYLLGYGYHKDLNLHLVLQTIDSLFTVANDEAWACVEAIAPAIAEVLSFTDGDETSHLKGELGSVLARRAFTKLSAYYLELVRLEEYQEAQGVLHGWLTHAALNDSIQQAIGCTAIDAVSLRTLSQRVQGGNVGAARILAFNATIFAPPAANVEVRHEISRMREEPIADPELYPPGRFAEFAAAARRTFARTDEAINAWLDFWLSRVGSEAVLNTLDREDPDGNLGDPERRFNLALEVRGQTAAFSYLVRSQRRRGWGWFTSDKGNRERWGRVRDLYRDRWFEFLLKSVRSDEASGHQRSRLVVGAPRLVEFLCHIGRKDEARAVAGTFVSSVGEALECFHLRPVSWTKHLVGERELLLSRLLWPSSLARERAACVIADELAKDTFGEFRRSFLDWTAKQQLESQVVPPLLAVQRVSNAYGKPLFHATEVIQAISHPSLISNMLLRELFGPSVALVAPFDLHSGSAPTAYGPPPTFERNLGVLPGIFSASAEEIEQNTSLQFRRQWAYEFERLCCRLGETPSRPDFHDWSDQRRGYIPTLDAKLTEAYVSAYLRALAWAIGRRLQMDVAEWYAAQTCPINLSLWRVAPNTRPEWLATRNITATLVEYPGPSTVHESFKQLFGELISANPPETLVQLQTRIASSPIVIDVCVDGFIQTTTGRNAPPEEVVRKWAETSPWVFPRSGPLEIEGSVEGGRAGRWLDELGDWLVHRLAGPVYTHASLRWQWWRLDRLVVAPAPYVIPDGYRIECGQSGVSMIAAQGRIGRWFDWLEDFEELRVGDLPPGSGCALYISTDLVQEWVERLRGSFCWLCTVRSYSREHEYEDYTKATSTSLIGATRIIRE